MKSARKEQGSYGGKYYFEKNILRPERKREGVIDDESGDDDTGEVR